MIWFAIGYALMGLLTTLISIWREAQADVYDHADLTTQTGVLMGIVWPITLPIEALTYFYRYARSKR